MPPPPGRPIPLLSPLPPPPQAIVIGGALSMSSSAFVLQLLKERGEMATRFGSATLGILLLQVGGGRRRGGRRVDGWHA